LILRLLSERVVLFAGLTLWFLVFGQQMEGSQKRRKGSSVTVVDIEDLHLTEHRFADNAGAVAEKLEGYYERTKADRGLPWREILGVNEQQRAYMIWVSEVMLQQTQAATVVPYFHRFLKKWPTLVSLSQASKDDVTAEWSGKMFRKEDFFLVIVYKKGSGITDAQACFLKVHSRL
jgi:hypothetical protein